MTEKNTIFALKSFTRNDDKLIHDGWLLLVNEESGENFINLCSEKNELNIHQNRMNTLKSHYEKEGYRRVTNFIFDKVSTRKSFFVKDINSFLLPDGQIDNSVYEDSKLEEVLKEID